MRWRGSRLRGAGGLGEVLGGRRHEIISLRGWNRLPHLSVSLERAEQSFLARTLSVRGGQYRRFVFATRKKHEVPIRSFQRYDGTGAAYVFLILLPVFVSGFDERGSFASEF